MSQTLYRKYRPKTFEEVRGQDHVVRTLQGALLSGNVGHAYLFCGPRGTGKTTIARLFAKALNCTQKPTTNNQKLTLEPCNICSSCEEINNNRSLDLIEIDAASNRGIDEIRNLKDSVRVAATSSAYKIFIIDEVHMLTPPAFNALLKTLEEPPSHVIFILATTEPHKILETILSRVQRFDFKKISREEIVQKLAGVAKTEKLEIDPAIFAVLASHSSGSLRDAESALAKLISYAGNKITIGHASEILGLVPLEIQKKFLTAIVKKEIQPALAMISDLYESGIDLENFTRQFINFLRENLINSVSAPSVASASADSDPRLLANILNVFLKVKNELKNSPVPQLPLELAVMELTTKN